VVLCGDGIEYSAAPVVKNSLLLWIPECGTGIILALRYSDGQTIFWFSGFVENSATWHKHPKWKKRSERRKHRACCSKAEPKNFAPPQTPSRGRRKAKI